VLGFALRETGTAWIEKDLYCLGTGLIKNAGTGIGRNKPQGLRDRGKSCGGIARAKKWKDRGGGGKRRERRPLDFEKRPLVFTVEFIY